MWRALWWLAIFSFLSFIRKHQIDAVAFEFPLFFSPLVTPLVRHSPLCTHTRTHTHTVCLFHGNMSSLTQNFIRVVPILMKRKLQIFAKLYINVAMNSEGGDDDDVDNDDDNNDKEYEVISVKFQSKLWAYVFACICLWLLRRVKCSLKVDMIQNNKSQQHLSHRLLKSVDDLLFEKSFSRWNYNLFSAHTRSLHITDTDIGFQQSVI